MTIDEVIQILKNDIELSKMNVSFCHNNEYGIGALQMAVETLEQTRWIPVSERLPESDDDVLVTDDAGGLAEVGIDWLDIYSNRWCCSQNVTAWMPLPEPYREIKHTCSECIIKDTDACTRGSAEADEVACEGFING